MSMLAYMGQAQAALLQARKANKWLQDICRGSIPREKLSQLSQLQQEIAKMIGFKPKDLHTNLTKVLAYLKRHAAASDGTGPHADGDARADGDAGACVSKKRKLNFAASTDAQAGGDVAALAQGAELKTVFKQHLMDTLFDGGVNGKVCVARWNFESAREVDLNFCTGQVIVIDEAETNHGSDENNRWFKGYIATDQDEWKGFFPSEYVIVM